MTHMEITSIGRMSRAMVIAILIFAVVGVQSVDADEIGDAPATANLLPSPRLVVEGGSYQDVSDLEFSPGSQTLAVAGWDNVWLWDMSKGVSCDIFAPPSGVSAIAFSPGGRTLAGVGIYSDALYLWNLENGSTRKLSGRAKSNYDLNFFAENRVFTVGEQHSATSDMLLGELWDLDKVQSQTKELSLEAPLFIYNKPLMAIEEQNAAGKFRWVLKDVRTGEIKRLLQQRPYAISSDLQTMATTRSGPKRSLQIFENNGDVEPSPVTVENNLNTIIQIWSLRAGHLLTKINGFLGSANVMALTEDGTFIAIGSSTGDLDGKGEISVWNSAGQRIWGSQAHRGLIRDVVWSPNKRWIASCAESGEINIWNARNGRLLVTLQTFTTHGKVTDKTSFDWIAYTPENYYVASPGANKYIQWRIGDTLYPAQEYSARFRRPDLVRKALAF